MKYDVFLSYSNKDQNLARQLTKKLEDNGLTVFTDSESILSNELWIKQLTLALENTFTYLMIFTENYISSDYPKHRFMYAAQLAKKSGVRILPIRTIDKELPDTWKFLIGDMQWFPGPFEEAYNNAISILVNEKKERKKAEILDRAYQSWSYGDYYAAEADINALLKDPAYENDSELNYELALLWEDERIYYSSMFVGRELLINLYKKVLRYSDPEKDKYRIEYSKQAIERLETETANENYKLPTVNADETFALVVLTSRMETAKHFEKCMGNSAPAPELNCLLIDYSQMLNFCSFFPVADGELAQKVNMCKEKITKIKAHLNGETTVRKEETRLLKAYRSYLGLARPEFPSYDVFISCKSEDEKYAQQVYDFLRQRGKRVFFATATLSALGDSEYRNAIMGALDHSKHFILVSSSMDYLNRSWVKHEWSTYIGESVEGRKTGNMVLIFHEDFLFKKEDLPIDIRRKEIISLSSFRDRVLDYLN